MKRIIKAPALVLVALAFAVASCGGGWSDDDKKKFTEECTKGGAPEKVCTCILDKMVEKYPDPETAKKQMEGDDKKWMEEETMKCLTGGEE